MVKELKEKASKIKLILLDVDGVLTDGRLYYTQNGEEIKVFNVKDGFGIKLAQKAGIEIGIISGRSSNALHKRLKDLGIEEIFTGKKDKLSALENIIERKNTKAEEIAYIGDDLVDIPVMRQVGFPIAVNDAQEIVKKYALYITKRQGGKGAVREAIEFILKLRGDLERVINEYVL